MSHWLYLLSEVGQGENDNEEEYDITDYFGLFSNAPTSVRELR